MTAGKDTSVRDLKVQTPGMTFGALEWGSAEDPLALCLHGYPDTAWTWRHVAPLLAAQGWHVVAPFSRGYGPTDLAPDGAYQLGALVRDAGELHSALGGDRRAVLIGHDWGATTAYALGAHRPDLFARMVTIAVPPLPALQAAVSPLRGVSVVPKLAKQARNSWYIAFQQLPVVSEAAFERVVRRLWADWSPGYQADEDLDLLFASLAEPRRRTAVLSYYRATVQPWRHKAAYADEQKAMFGAPSVPVLYLHGRDDGCIAAELCNGALAALAPGSQFVLVDGAGHFVQLEKPDETARLVIDFVS